jgi:outer membrane immunogenic protein
MRTKTSMKIALALIPLAVSAHAASAQERGTLAVGGGYTYVRANLVPGCGCFGMNGGSAEFNATLALHFKAIADVTATHAGGLTPDGYSLTQTTFMGGIRYDHHLSLRMVPFGDAAFGLAHASGTLAPAQTGYGKANTFAMRFGGGVQVPFGQRLRFIPVQAEYMRTSFGNGSANRQNELRVSAGLLWTIRRR